MDNQWKNNRHAGIQNIKIQNPEDVLKPYIHGVPDFPGKGVLFRDITPLLSNPDMFRYAVEQMTCNHIGKGITKVVALESRGFIFAPVALNLQAGLVLVRKAGKLPRETYMTSYELEYGHANIEIHKDCMNENDVALIVDDVLATGGTADAAGTLTTHTGARIAGYQFLIELDALKGREKLNAPIYSVLHY
jgi:adenine phosphoribosyltransferase